jgi:putative multiple sugar transport system ATP-binding protein
LLQLLLQFKAQGISSILISHKLGEVSRVADSITILRDGATIETLDCRKDVITEDRIIRGMVGRDMTHRFPPREHNIGETIFEVKDWTVHHPAHAGRIVVDNVNLHVRRGEVVGIAGLMGSGRTELAMSIFGHSYGRNISGTVSKHGQAIDVSSIDRAIANGIAYGTEDRKTYGLVLIQDIKNNVTLANLGAVANGFVINEPKEMVEAQNYQRQLSIKCSSILQKTVNLSGGNQQKVVLSKWLFAEPEILILDEPTRGIDVGAKYEIYTLINRMADEGKGVIVISSETARNFGHLRPRLRDEQRQVRGRTDARGSHARGDYEMHHESRGGRSMETLKRIFSENIRQYSMLLALIAIMVFFQVITERRVDEAAQL